MLVLTATVPSAATGLRLGRAVVVLAWILATLANTEREASAVGQSNGAGCSWLYCCTATATATAVQLQLRQAFMAGFELLVRRAGVISPSKEDTTDISRCTQTVTQKERNNDLEFIT